MADARGEPTMEEILASIRRIIAEDPAPTRQTARKAAARQAADAPEEQPEAVAGSDFAAAMRAASDDMHIPPVPDAPADGPGPGSDSFTSFDPAEPADAGEDEEVLELTEIAEEPEAVILSDRIASVTAEKLQHFSESVTGADAASAADPAAGALALEAMVREMLRPMLKQWLDTHLPDIVDQVVSREIARLTGKGR